MASYKTFYLLSIAHYNRKELCLINIRIISCRYNINKSMMQFFFFIHILVRKHVNASEISPVKSLKIIDIEGTKDTNLLFNIGQILVFKTYICSSYRSKNLIFFFCSFSLFRVIVPNEPLPKTSILVDSLD